MYISDYRSGWINQRMWTGDGRVVVAKLGKKGAKLGKNCTSKRCQIGQKRCEIGQKKGAKLGNKFTPKKRCEIGKKGAKLDNGRRYNIWIFLIVMMHKLLSYLIVIMTPWTSKSIQSFRLYRHSKDGQFQEKIRGGEEYSSIRISDIMIWNI